MMTFADMWDNLDFRGMDPASQLAAAGVPPPALPQQAPMPRPSPFGATEDVWSPQTADQSDPALAQAPAPAAASQPQQPGGAERLVQALRGMAPPRVPEPQRVGTPSVAGRPPADRSQGPSLMDLLMLSQAARPKPTLQLPSTLGGALGGR